MHNGNDLRLINAVMDATADEFEKRGLSLSVVTRRIFTLVESGERDFDTLKAAACEVKTSVVETVD